MPKFSQESISKLSTCHLDLQVLFFKVIETIDCTIIQGHRGEQEQEIAFANGNTKLHYPLSEHNKTPSMAVDCMMYPIDWDDIRRIYYFSGFVQATALNLFEQNKMKHKIRFGGDWNGTKNFKENKFNDLDHWELI